MGWAARCSRFNAPAVPIHPGTSSDRQPPTARRKPPAGWGGLIRLAPAMRTCRAVTERQEVLSARVARATELLSTRVEISSERQSHALLESMNRRAILQLRLQETVEGLSVAAITYYVVSLVGHAAEGLEALGVHANPSIAMAVAIPVVALAVAFGVRRIRRSVARVHGAGLDL